MRIAICDDEEIFLNEIKDKLEDYYSSLDVYIAEFISPELLIKRVEENSECFDVIFLDIEMPKYDGIKTAKKIKSMNNDIKIIFLTSHIELAMDGYEVDAFRFLSKPVNEEKLHKALRDLEKASSERDSIIINDGDERYIIKIKDILYIKAENVYLKIYTTKESYLIRKKIGELEEELDKRYFYRTHRSFIVNIINIKSFRDKKILMINNEEIPLSRNKISEFKEKMMSYFRNHN